jgi:hypothetical protein
LDIKYIFHKKLRTLRKFLATMEEQMPTINFKITGENKWKAGIVEDNNEIINPVTFNGETSNFDVAGGGLAWFSIFIRGQPGASITAEIFKGDISIVTKRNYKIDPDGSLARAIQFNPDA